MKPSEMRVVLCTCPAGVADELARSLVVDGLVACVNIVPAIQSIYRWDDALQCDAESLMLLKTHRARIDDLERALLERHPYDVPEILVLGVESGSEAYLDWVSQQTALPAE